MKQLHSSCLILGKRRRETIQALLIFEFAVIICSLTIGSAVELPARTNPQAMVGAAALGASNRLSDMAAAEPGPRLDGETSLSTAEFAAASRAGRVDVGYWDAWSKTFIIEPAITRSVGMGLELGKPLAAAPEVAAQ